MPPSKAVPLPSLRDVGQYSNLILMLSRVTVTTTSGAFSCLVDLVPEPVDAGYDLKLGRGWFNYCTVAQRLFLVLKYYFRMICASSFHYLHFLLCAHIKQVSF